MILLNLEGLVFLIPVILWFGPPLILIIVGSKKIDKNKKTAKILFIIAAIYVLIGGGICANILMELNKSMGYNTNTFSL